MMEYSMPSRIIREGILTSPRVNALSSGAELFYRRLLSVADDYGRYHGHPTLLRAATFPLKMDVVNDEHVTKWLDETIKQGLIRAYEVKGQKYVEIQDFGQKARSKSKFPAPCEQSAGNLQAKCSQPKSKMNHLDVVVVEDVKLPCATSSRDEPEKPKEPKGVTYPDDFEVFWSHYPRRKDKGAALKAWKKLNAADKQAAIDRAEWVRGCWEHWDPDEERRRFIQAPATWLNARGWEDEDSAVEIMARGK